MSRAKKGSIGTEWVFRLSIDLDTTAREAAAAEGLNVSEWWRRAGERELERKARSDRHKRTS